MASRSSDPASGDALGLLETQGLVAAIEGTDAMLKAARVRLVGQDLTVPGLITCTVVGETAAVRAAVDAGRAAAERVGRVVSAHVIPRPGEGVVSALGLGAAEEAPQRIAPRRTAPAPVKQTKKASGAASEDLAGKTVAELRSLAREHDDDAFSGRAISRASKDDLLAFLRGARGTS